MKNEKNEKKRFEIVCNKMIATNHVHEVAEVEGKGERDSKMKRERERGGGFNGEK